MSIGQLDSLTRKRAYDDLNYNTSPSLSRIDSFLLSFLNVLVPEGLIDNTQCPHIADTTPFMCWTQYEKVTYKFMLEAVPIMFSSS